MKHRNIRGPAQVWILVVCLVVGVASVYLQFSRLKTTEAELADVQNEISQVEVSIKLEKERSVTDQVRVVPASKEEESTFIGEFRTLAAANSVSVMRWINSGIATPAASASKPSGPNDAAPPPAPTLTPLAADIELEGNYLNIRKFMDELQKSKRLVFVENASWARIESGQIARLNCRILRFVDPTMTNAESTSAGATPGNLGGTN